MPKTKDNSSCESLNRERSFWAAPVLFLVIGAIFFGVWPGKSFFWNKCWITQGAVVIFLACIFIRSWPLKLFLIWCLFGWSQTFARPGVYKLAAFSAFHFIFLYLMTYQALLTRLRSNWNNVIINSICFWTILQLVYMFFQLFGIDPLFGKAVNPHYTTKFVTAFWGHTNISGASLAIALPLFFRRKWWVFVPLILFMLVMAESLGAIIAAAAGVLFYLMFSKTIPRTGKAIILIVILAGVFIYGTKIDPSQFKLNNDRVSILKPTIKLIKMHPIIGTGLSQYKFAFKQIVHHVFGGKNTTTHAHFDFAELVFDTGAIGGGLVLCFLGSVFWWFRKNITTLSLVAAAGAVAALVNSCSTFLFHTPLAWIFLILIVVVKKEEKS